MDDRILPCAVFDRKCSYKYPNTSSSQIFIQKWWEKNTVSRCFIVALSAVSACQILAVISLNLTEPSTTPSVTLMAQGSVMHRHYSVLLCFSISQISIQTLQNVSHFLGEIALTADPWHMSRKPHFVFTTERAWSRDQVSVNVPRTHEGS